MADNFTPEEISAILEEFFNVVGTRQYIGARYLPIFGRRGEDSIEWDNTAPYEPLTIVLHEGASYTSRTYVPAGVNITNQTYWALSGNYNAQVEAYRQEVSTFDDRITANAEGVEDNANAIAAEATARENADATIDDKIGTGFTSDSTIRMQLDEKAALEMQLRAPHANSTPNMYFFNCFMSYYNNNNKLKYIANPKTDGMALRYTMIDGNLTQTPLNQDSGRYFIDCNTLVQLVLAGIDYESSRYSGIDNVTTQPYSFRFPNGNNSALKYYTFQNNENLIELMGNNAGVGRWAANQMALYFYESGALTRINDYSQLQFGDVIFREHAVDQESPDTPTTEWGEEYGYWRGISHVAFFLGRLENVILVAECNGTSGENNPIKITRVSVDNFTNNASSQNPSHYVYFFRPPLNVPQNVTCPVKPNFTTYALNTLASSTRIATRLCDINEDDIVLVNLNVPIAQNVYMTIVNAENNSQSIVIRTDTGSRSAVIQGFSAKRIHIYAVPLGGNTGIFQLDGIEFVKYTPTTYDMMSIPRNLSGTLTSVQDLRTLFDGIALTGIPCRCELYFDYATSEEIEGLNNYVGITHITLYVNHSASYNAIAHVQNGTQIHDLSLARSGSTYSEWTLI